jgi:hypothetical protein
VHDRADREPHQPPEHDPQHVLWRTLDDLAVGKLELAAVDRGVDRSDDEHDG